MERHDEVLQLDPEDFLNLFSFSHASSAARGMAGQSGSSLEPQLRCKLKHLNSHWILVTFYKDIVPRG